MGRIVSSLMFAVAFVFCLVVGDIRPGAAANVSVSNRRFGQMRFVGVPTSQYSSKLGKLTLAVPNDASSGTPVISGQATYLSGYVEYYPSSCTELSSGSWAITAAPKYGTVSFGTVTGASGAGDCPGVNFTYGAIYYTWTANNGATSDSFSATWTSPDFTEPRTFNLVLSNVDPLKNQGPCECSDVNAGTGVGDPINGGTGGIFETQSDFAGAPHTHVGLTRYYNSQITTTPSVFGANWSYSFNSFVNLTGTVARVARPTGQVETFNKKGSAWVADADVTDVLTPVTGGGWRLLLSDDSVETFAADGALSTITTRAGLVTKMTYNSSAQLATVTGPFGHVLNFTYDSDGRIVQMTAPDGGAYAYAYDSNSNLISVTYPDLSKRQYVYEDVNFPNFLTGVIDEDGNRYTTWGYKFNGMANSSQHANGVDQTTLVYNADGTTTTTDARGNSFTSTFGTKFGLVKLIAMSGAPVQTAGGKAFAYDANGFISSRTDWNGHFTSYTHDARGDETSRILAAGTAIAETITTSWHPTFHLPTQIVEPNRSTSFGYDANGNLMSRSVTASGVTSTWSYTYTSVGQVLSATDPLGDVTHYAYDAHGDLTSVTNALGQVTRFTSFDADGRPLTIKDPNGLVTTLAYNFRGEVTSRSDAQWVTSYAYDAVGQLTTLKRPDGSSLAFTCDAAQRLVSVADSLGNRIAYTLDLASNRVNEQVFNGSNTLVRTRAYAYDSVNRLSEAIGALNQTTNYSHDPQGNLTGVSDPLSHVTSIAYNARDEQALVTDPTGGQTSLGYDPEARLNSVQDPRGLSTAYSYNGLDNVTLTKSPDTGRAPKSYDAAGNLLLSKDARSDTAAYYYDALNRFIRVVYSDGTTIKYGYDQGANGIGRLTSMVDPGGTTIWAYNIHGQEIGRQQTTGTVTLTTRRTFSPVTGQQTALTYPSGTTIFFGYDGDGRVSVVGEVQSGGNATVVKKVAYQPFGPVASWVAGNGAAYSRAFDTDGRISGLFMPSSDNLALTFDAANRITRIAETGLPAKTFGYDASNRLTGYAYGPITQTYAYDLVGNRTSYVSTGAGAVNLNYTYDTASNLLFGIGGDQTQSFVYDASGNTVTHETSGTYEFTYDARGRMSSAALGAFTTTYLVNGLGQRTEKIDQSISAPTYFAYDGAGHLLGEYGSKGAVIQETVWLGDLPVATLQPGGAFYIAPDHLGAPHEITNATGQVVWSWDHDPFGNGLPKVASGFSYDLRFPGQIYDQETKFNYNYYRDYDPTLGRYVESDPIGLAGGINIYAYVMGNPTSRRDPRGLCDQSATHNYTINQFVLCDPTETFGLLKASGNSAPGAPGAPEGFTPRINLIGGNPISQNVNSQAMTITNTTLPGHIFYPGQVTIEVTPGPYGGAFINIIGTGTGQHPIFNDIVGDVIFGNMVSNIAEMCANAQYY